MSIEASSSRSVYLPSNPARPAQILTTDENVSIWPTTPGFRGFWSWIQRRCDRIKGTEIMTDSYELSSPGIRGLMNLLEKMTDWVREVPPLPQTNQRFGNLAFRQYYRLIEQRIPPLLSKDQLPPFLAEQILPLFLDSNAFGHPIRLDYGTGHELAFVLGLWCCVVSGWIGGEDREDEEDELILRVFNKYLDLIHLLQVTYKLEPAGSHGVWGLDDYCFLSYLFGSAQVLDSELSPSQCLRLAQSSPSPSQITNLFTLSLQRLTTFKTGAPFSEHSPLLFQLCQMPTWNKPQSGLRKMFLGEVIGKRVVVQGLWIGGWCWGEDMPGTSVDGVHKKKEKERKVNEVMSRSGNGTSDVETGVPWKQNDTRQQVLNATKSAWSSTNGI